MKRIEVITMVLIRETDEDGDQKLYGWMTGPSDDKESIEEFELTNEEADQEVAEFVSNFWDHRP